jgi:hypothetical protein
MEEERRAFANDEGMAVEGRGKETSPGLKVLEVAAKERK